MEEEQDEITERCENKDCFRQVLTVLGIEYANKNELDMIGTCRECGQQYLIYEDVIE